MQLHEKHLFRNRKNKRSECEFSQKELSKRSSTLHERNECNSFSEQERRLTVRCFGSLNVWHLCCWSNGGILEAIGFEGYVIKEEGRFWTKISIKSRRVLGKGYDKDALINQARDTCGKVLF